MEKPAKKPGLVLFDYNGTLLNDVEHVYECGVQRIFRTFGLSCPSLDEYRNEVTADFMGSFYWPRGIPAHITADDLNAIMRAGFKEKGRPAELFPDTKPALAELRRRGYRLALISAYARDLLDNELAIHGLAGGFNVVVGDVRDKASCFTEVAGRMLGTADKAEIAGGSVAVGDTTTDAEASAAVGIYPFLCPRGFHSLKKLEVTLRRLGTGMIVSDLEEIARFLP